RVVPLHAVVLSLHLLGLPPGWWGSGRGLPPDRFLPSAGWLGPEQGPFLLFPEGGWSRPLRGGGRNARRDRRCREWRLLYLGRRQHLRLLGRELRKWRRRL